ncbi:hypothetical protein P3T39_006479 [Kitasatospora sp. GP82]|nr:hypothetical protein [Kitasatospora sp. GP82]
MLVLTHGWPSSYAELLKVVPLLTDPGAHGGDERDSFDVVDSPVGLAAWIVDRFRAWSDCDGDAERRLGKDELLTQITVYWATGLDRRSHVHRCGPAGT